jgi:hypothetical protein
MSLVLRNVIDLTEHQPRRLARTTYEVQFAMTLIPCARCGFFDRDATRFRPTRSSIDATPAYQVEGACPTCAELKTLICWALVPSPGSKPLPVFQLGGLEPSQIIEPWRLMEEIERLWKECPHAPASLTTLQLQQHIGSVERLATCANELRKFVAMNQETLIATEYSDVGKRYRFEHSPQYQAFAVQAMHSDVYVLFTAYRNEGTRREALNSDSGTLKTDN